MVLKNVGKSPLLSKASSCVKFFASGIQLAKVLKSVWVRKLLFFAKGLAGEGGDGVG